MLCTEKQGGHSCWRCYHERKAKRWKCPLNKEFVKILVITYINAFSSAFSITMLFPFLPFMVEFLLPQIDPSSVSTYAGIIVSSMHVGRTFGSYIWGTLSDTWGRKPVLIISQLLLGISSLAFGFSVTFPMAVVLRFFVGLSNGIKITSKAIVSECSTNRTQPLSLSVLASAWSVGIIVGPAISGAIADPVGQYDLNITNGPMRWFLQTFPYSLPGIVNLFFSIVAIATTACLLPETLKSKRKQTVTKRDDAIEMLPLAVSTNDPVIADTTNHGMGEGKEIEEAIDDKSEDKHSNCDSQQSLLDADCGHDDSDPSCNDPAQYGASDDVDKELKIITEPKKRRESFVLSIINIPNRRNSAFLEYIKMPKASRNRQLEEGNTSNQVELLQEIGEKDKRGQKCLPFCPKSRLVRVKKSAVKSLKTLKEFLKNPLTRLTLIIYCYFMFCDIGISALYPLWCATPSYLGGLSFTLSEIGISLSIVGGLLLPCTLFFFPILERKFGSVTSFQMILVLQMFLIILLPNIHFLVPVKPRIVLWVCLIVVLYLIKIAADIGDAATSLFINNSVTFDKLGSFNGLTMSVSSAARCIAPLFAGGILSVSLSEKNQSLGFPLDYHLIFVLFGILLLILLLVTSRLPYSINNQLQKVDSTPTSLEEA